MTGPRKGRSVEKENVAVVSSTPGWASRGRVGGGCETYEPSLLPQASTLAAALWACGVLVSLPQ